MEFDLTDTFFYLAAIMPDIFFFSNTLYFLGRGFEKKKLMKLGLTYRTSQIVRANTNFYTLILYLIFMAPHPYLNSFFLLFWILIANKRLSS